MKLKLSSSILCTAALMLATPIFAAQKPANTGPKYDLANEVTVKGSVEDLPQLPTEVGIVHLMVKTDQGNVLVYVAPADFLKEIDTSFNKGDLIEVKGAKTPNPLQEEVLAREITVGTNTTTLRDDKGIPVWAGWSPAKVN